MSTHTVQSAHLAARRGSSLCRAVWIYPVQLHLIGTPLHLSTSWGMQRNVATPSVQHHGLQTAAAAPTKPSEIWHFCSDFSPDGQNTGRRSPGGNLSASPVTSVRSCVQQYLATIPCTAWNDRAIELPISSRHERQTRTRIQFTIYHFKFFSLFV